MMARKITPAQRRALLWLAKAAGDTQKAMHWMIGANVSAQTVHNLHYAGLIRVVSRKWDGSIDTVRITAAGREMIAAKGRRSGMADDKHVTQPKPSVGASAQRDTYVSVIAVGLLTSGPQAAAFDVMNALYAMRRLASTRGLLQEQCDGADGDATLEQLLEIACYAVETSVAPAVQIYAKLHTNAAQAREMAEAFPSDREWHEMLTALDKTLQCRQITTRNEVERAQRINEHRTAQKGL